MTTERTGPAPFDSGRSNPDTKAAREEKQKVEKVREIDADEETQRRRKKFQMMMGDEEAPVDLEPRSPSPFETTFYTATASDGGSMQGGFSATSSSSSFGSIQDSDDFSDLEGAVVPSPSYSAAPDISASMAAEEEDPITGSLPQSDDFWEAVDLPPDQPLQPQQFQETPQSAPQPSDPSEEQTEQPAAQKPASKAPSPFGPPGKPIGKQEPSISGNSQQKGMVLPAKPGSTTGKKSSPQPPGKPVAGTSSGLTFSGKETVGSARLPLQSQKPDTTGFIRAPEGTGKGLDTTASRAIASREDTVGGPAYPGQPPETKRSAQTPKGKDPQIAAAASFGEGKEVFSPRSESGEKEGRDRGKERQTEILAPSLPSLPRDVQPAAQTAATQATPYLSPSTMPLFYQMVGTIYMMRAPTGVSRTEIVLNNPAFADSKFFGSTITIEKYASAPDSFNIRLSGTDAAVVAFKDNIPSLLTAFQNGKFNFRVNRIDAVYSADKPFFRRKEKGEDRGGADDSRDRRK